MFKLLVLFVGSLVLSYGAIGAETHKMSGHKMSGNKMPNHKVDAKKIAQKKCPVMGGKINPKLYYKYKGQNIYVCCPGCISTIKKNPEMYLKKVQKEIAVASKKTSGKEKTPPENTTNAVKSHCGM